MGWMSGADPSPRCANVKVCNLGHHVFDVAVLDVSKVIVAEVDGPISNELPSHRVLQLGLDKSLYARLVLKSDKDIVDCQVSVDDVAVDMQITEGMQKTPDVELEEREPGRRRLVRTEPPPKQPQRFSHGFKHEAHVRAFW